MAPLDYDYLVLGAGRARQLLRRRGRGEHAFPLYTLADALRLKEHILERWEAADRDPALVEDGALNIVIVGGGPTGVESAGALAELYRNDFSKDYPGVTEERGPTDAGRGRAVVVFDVQAATCAPTPRRRCASAAST